MLKKKIKITYIIPTLDFGGAERMVVDLLRKIDKEKYDVKIICLKRAGKFADNLKSANVELIVLGEKLGIKLFLKLYKMLKSDKPDIVHTHLFGADVFGILAAKLADIKNIISTEHNINYFEGRKKRLIKKFVYFFADHIIAVSGAVKKYLLSEGINKNKIAIIYNGVDINNFAISRKYEIDKTLIIGSVGRLDKQKGYNTLISALSELKAENIECRIAGEGPEKFDLEDLINSLGLNKKVKLAGWINNVPDFLKQVDIFILPSQWEGFGITIIEAGATGLPVIASNVDGIKEIIIDNKDGLLIDPNDSKEIARKIRLLADNPELRKKLGVNLSQKVREKFSLESMIAKYDNLYFELVNMKKL